MACWDVIRTVIKCSKWRVTWHINERMSNLLCIEIHWICWCYVWEQFWYILPALQETSCMVWRCYVPSAGVHMMSWYPLNMVKMFPHPLVSPWSPITVALALIFTLVARVLQWWRPWEWDYSKDTWLGLVNRTVAYVWIYTYISHNDIKTSLRTTFCPRCDCKFPVCIAWGQAPASLPRLDVFHL